MHEEPIVCSVDDAFRAFVSSKIDYLIVGKKATKRKVEVARELNIKIINQADWIKMLNKRS